MVSVPSGLLTCFVTPRASSTVRAVCGAAPGSTLSAAASRPVGKGTALFSFFTHALLVMPCMLSPILELRRRSAAPAERPAAARLVASWTIFVLGLFALAPAAVSQPTARPAPAATAAAAPAATPAAPTSPAPGAPTGPTTGPPAIVVLGDSLSAGYGIRVEEGWVALLQKRLREQGYGYRVVNASVSGETTGGALARLPRVLQVHRPAVVIVELGGNDGLRGVPVPELRSNLERIVTLSKQAGAGVLIAGMRIPSNYGPQYTERFFATYAEVAKQHRVALVPFFLERIALEDRFFQPDRIHPTAAAQPYLLDNVWPALQPLLKKSAAAKR
jgi:acyl-CoA thioesterase-1